ncbi:aminotransferase class I/II-fold pyridoxal phosphate-dependent enzyme [Pyramidobacter piscolens]
MEYRIARAVKNQARVSYALGAETPPCEVDCGEGVNVELASPAARRAFATLDFNMCAPYPHANELKEAIAAYWKDYAALGDENIVLTEGSVSGLYLVNRLFLEPNDRVLGGASLFFEYGADVRLHGCFFETVPLKAEENYRFSAARFAAALSPRFKLAAFDNPNNPTGQAISPAELERILAAAREANVCVLVDEAYGDYVPRGRSAVSLFDAYDNLIVARSFSKGFGLAGLRAGYLLLPPGLAAAANNLSNPYAVS